MTYFSRAQSPPREEGWTRHQEKWREASFDGADGVVAYDEIWRVSDHPVCAFGAATPPHEEGNNKHA
jgi:hypothetical protein